MPPSPRSLALLLCLFVAVPVPARSEQAAPPVAQRSPAESLNQERPERGWFYYEDPRRVSPPPEAEPAPPPPLPPLPPPREERCKGKQGWTADCGFVNPGDDFDFQAKQRDVLLQQMVMSNNAPKAVEAFQYYMRWVMTRASEVANLWQYNMVQNPDLDPNAQSPVSPFGLRLMTEVKQGRAADIFRALRSEDAMLVFFTRSDCEFCHGALPLVQMLGKDTGLPVWNAALDDRCMAGFTGRCQSGKAVTAPAQALQVSIVPTLFLYVPPNTWIRVATGVVDVDTMKGRVASFFAAYRNALLKGVNNSPDARPPVDFAGTEATGTARGVQATNGPRLPTEAELNGLLGKR